jgi:DNA repair protein RadC
MRISALPAQERPRERCWRLGAESLSAVELLAIVLGGGGRGDSGLTLAHTLLENFASLADLGRAKPSELAALPGLAMARSAALAAAFELGRRAAQPVRAPLTMVEGPSDAADIVRPWLANLRQEAVTALYLGGRHQLLHVQIVALGGLNAASVEPREVFRGAVASAACAIVLAHNHPSGSPEPSEDDVRLTHRLARCGETLGIEVLDHLVLGEGSFVSLRERGLMGSTR